MAVASIFTVLVLSTVLCIAEIPKMRRNKLYKELWVFSILLVLGTILAILKSLGVKIPNPSDWIAWVYSPVKGIMKGLLK